MTTSLRVVPSPSIHAGEMAEWLKAHAWKACLLERVTWVRIPLSPPVFSPHKHWRLSAHLAFCANAVLASFRGVRKGVYMEPLHLSDQEKQALRERLRNLR